jgi:mannose-6-phosphate isomerase class I
MSKEIIFFNPVVKNLVWGSEIWTISAHEHGDVLVQNGRYKGMSLSQLWQEQPSLFGNTNTSSKDFPLLVKIITAHDDLSIQVHPDDRYAAEHENGANGKTECWYILDCKEDTHLVLGHNARDKEELQELIESNRFAELICEVPIAKGDFFQINPGTVHAIKGGTRLLEIQQSSDITYRLYDYGRIVDGKPRPLHLEQALEVIVCPAETVTSQLPFSCDYYMVWELAVAGEATINQSHPFLIVCVIAGEGFIDGQPIKENDHFILPNAYGEAKLKGEMKLILAAAGRKNVDIEFGGSV